MNQGLYVKLFLLILALAIFVRFFKLGEIPVSLYWDEVAILVDAKSIATTGHDMHNRPWYQLMYPSYGDYKLPVYIWLAGLSVKIFGASEWAVRLPSALAGVGTILVSGLIVRELFKNIKENNSQLMQLLTMAVVAFSPWSIMFSRTAFEGHLAQFFVVLSIYLVIWTHNDRSKQFQTLFYCLASVIGALATYTYFSVRFVWPVIFLSVQLFFIIKLVGKQKVSQIIKNLAISTALPLLIFFALLIPMLNSPLYEASNQFRYSTTSVLNKTDYALLSNQQREKAGNTLTSRIIYHRHFLLARELAKNYADHLSLNYIFVSGDQNLRHGTGQHGLFLLTLMPVFIYGLFKLFLTNKRTLALLVTWWLISLLPASVPDDTPHALRSLNALMPISLIIAFGLYHLVNLALRHLNSKRFQVLLVGCVILILANFAHFYNHYFWHYPKESAMDWQYGYKEIGQMVGQEMENVTEIWVDQSAVKVYLWTFAFGGLSPQEIQQIPKEGFEVGQFANVNFSKFDWKKLETNPFKTIIIDNQDDILYELDRTNLKPNWIKEIDNLGEPAKFVVVHFGQ